MLQLPLLGLFTGIIVFVVVVDAVLVAVSAVLVMVVVASVASIRKRRTLYSKNQNSKRQTSTKIKHWLQG